MGQFGWYLGRWSGQVIATLPPKWCPDLHCVVKTERAKGAVILWATATKLNVITSLSVSEVEQSLQLVFTSGDSTLVYKCSFSPPSRWRTIEHGGIETNELNMTPTSFPDFGLPGFWDYQILSSRISCFPDFELSRFRVSQIVSSRILSFLDF